MQQISKEDLILLGAKKLNKEQNAESDIYILQDLIYNFPKIMHGQRKAILKSIYHNQEYFDIDRLELLQNEQSNIIGFSMLYYEDYQELYDVLSDNLDFEYRKYLVLQILNIFYTYYNKGIIYHDFHSKNFLVKDMDMKVLDFASCIFRRCGNYGETFAITNLMELCFSVFTGIDWSFDLATSSKVLLAELLGVSVKRVRKINMHDLEVFHSQMLDITEEKVKKKQLVIAKSGLVLD